MARVVHFEAHAENPDRAMEFYRSALGWQFQKWNGLAGVRSPVDVFLTSRGRHYANTYKKP